MPDVQTHPAGTQVAAIRRWDRTTKVVITCPQHGGEWRTKDPYSSQWFGGQDLCGCPVAEFVTAAPYYEPMPSQGLWDAKTARINECPELLYSYSPASTRADTRWVFKGDKICTDIDEALDYVNKCADALRSARATAIVTGSTGAVHEVRDTDGQLLGRGDYTRPQAPASQ